MANRLKTEFLLGIGVGCIISAFLVSVFGVGTISDQQVMARAAKLGMVQPTMSGKSNPENKLSNQGLTSPQQTSEQAQASKQSQTPEQSQTSGQPQTSEQPTGIQDVKQDIALQPKNSAESFQQEGKTNPAETAAITITDRMASETIARILEEKGIIKDQYEFLKVISEHDAHRRLQTGTFKVPISGDLEEILDILSGKKR